MSGGLQQDIQRALAFAADQRFHEAFGALTDIDASYVKSWETELCRARVFKAFSQFCLESAVNNGAPLPEIYDEMLAQNVDLLDEFQDGGAKRRERAHGQEDVQFQFALSSWKAGFTGNALTALKRAISLLASTEKANGRLSKYLDLPLPMVRAWSKSSEGDELRHPLQQELCFGLNLLLGRYTDAVQAFINSKAEDAERSFPVRFKQSIEELELDWIGILAETEKAIEAKGAVHELVWWVMQVLSKSGEADIVKSFFDKHRDFLMANKMPDFVGERLLADVGLTELISSASKRLDTQLSDALRAQDWDTVVELFDAPERRHFAQQAVAIASELSVPTYVPTSERNTVAIVGRDRPHGTVVVFAGLADGGEFRFSLLDAFFAKLGLTAIYLYDAKRAVYCLGIDELGNGLEETLEGLRKIIDEIHPDKPVYTFGNSAGGFAAVLYAHGLKADATISFSPPVTLNPEEGEERFGDRRARLTARRLARNVDFSRFDLKTLMPEMKDTYQLVVYGPGDDCMDHLHSADYQPFENADVRWVDGVSTHNTLGALAMRESLIDVFAAVFKPPLADGEALVTHRA